MHRTPALNILLRATAAGLLAVMVTFLSSPAMAQDRPTPNFDKLRYGIFVHHAWGGHAYDLTHNPDLTAPKSIDELTSSFDIPKFVKDIQSFDPEYLTITAWHAEMNPIFPSAAMEKWRGPGHDSKRDVIAELIKELKPTGIKLFLYVHPSDGHDMSKHDQEVLGWNESQGGTWTPGKYVKWNNFINDVFDEMCQRYGTNISGFWVDGGWERIDKQRLQNTAWKYNPDAEFVTGMDCADPVAAWVKYAPVDYHDVNTWPGWDVQVNILEGGCWYSTGQAARLSPEHLFKYTVLQAATNTRGGGVGWAADPYTDGTWEPNVRKYLMTFASLLKPIEESIKNTRPSAAYPLPPGTKIQSLPYGVAATESDDGRFEYLHVLRPPSGWSDRTIQLPPPANGRRYESATVLTSGRAATIAQDAKGLRVDLPWQDAWDPLDTVIKLKIAEPQQARS